MAKKHNKKKTTPEDDELKRQSRKEILRARKEAEQTKQIRLAVGGVAGLLILVFLVAIVNEMIIAPNKAVATIGNEEISVRQWEDRVRYERAQRIISLENQYELFNGDVGLIQQYSRQTILDLLDDEALAENVLNQMTDEVIIRQAAQERGITVTDAELDKEIGSYFNYYDGKSPTPAPTPTETIMPTPSLTPIPTAVITDVVPTNTPFPTAVPGPVELPPTATPVSKESFDEELGGLLKQFSDLGVKEETFREVVRMQMYTRRLADALAEEQAMPTEAMHASIFLLSFATQEAADEALAMIQTEDFLTVWNTFRSLPPDPESGITAGELLWRTQESLAASLGSDAAEAAFVLPPNVPSPVIAQPLNAETTQYHILQVSGRQMRELPEATLQSMKSDLVRALVAGKSASVTIDESWRSRIPTQPMLDPKFLAQPTAVPAAPDAGSGDGSVPLEDQ